MTSPPGSGGAPSQLIFINRVYWPEEAATAQLLHDLAPALAARGLPVRVITSRRRGQPAQETADGVVIRRILPWISRGTSLLSRAGNYASYLLGAAATVRANARPGDVIVAMTDPPLLGVGVAAAVARHRARLWHWCQDVYPELAMGVAAAGIMHTLLRQLQPLRDRAWRAAEGCAVLGADMAELAAERGVSRERIHIVPNWAPAGLRPADGGAMRSKWGVDSRFVVAYSGNLGRAHVLEPVLTLADRLRSRRDIVFLFVGEGAQRPRLESAAQARGLTNVRFLPPQLRSDLSASLAAADLHLVTIRPGCEQTVWPSKFYGIVAAERPMVYIGPPDAEVAQLVQANTLGASFGPNEPHAIAAFIESVADNPARGAELRTAVRRFAANLPGRAAATEHWARVLTAAPMVRR